MEKPSKSDTPLRFSGFQDHNSDMIRIPESFFTKLLQNIETLPQLRLLLYLFWHAEHQEKGTRHFRFDDLAADPTLVRMTGGKDPLKQALDALVRLGAVLKAKPIASESPIFFINGPQGRAALQAIQEGTWHQVGLSSTPMRLPEDRPNIFQLYEENIGAITPMISEILKEDEKTYPEPWIEEAIRIAVTRNARNWKFFQAILKRWKKEGRGYEQDRRDGSQDPNSYREGWLKHD